MSPITASFRFVWLAAKKRSQVEHCGDANMVPWGTSRRTRCNANMAPSSEESDSVSSRVNLSNSCDSMPCCRTV
eukprot:15448204-Alexandrium_andersonii.AAC.2